MMSNRGSRAHGSAGQGLGDARQGAQYGRNMLGDGASASGQKGAIQQGVDDAACGGIKNLVGTPHRNGHRARGAQAGLDLAEGDYLCVSYNIERVLDLFGGIKKHGYRATLCVENSRLSRLFTRRSSGTSSPCGVHTLDTVLRRRGIIYHINARRCNT